MVDGLVAHTDTQFRRQILEVSKSKAKAVRPPDKKSYDLHEVTDGPQRDSSACSCPWYPLGPPTAANLTVLSEITYLS